MSVNPNQVFGPTLYPSGGWLRVAMIAGVPAIIDSWQFSVDNNLVFQDWIVPSLGGYKQKTLHARGTTEVNWDLRGDLTVEGSSLVEFLNPLNRGLQFSLTVQQFGVVDYFKSCVFESFNIVGDPGVAVKFNMRGKSLQYPIQGNGFTYTNYQHLVPSWGTGNTLVSQWSITHSVPLSPVWWNNQSVLPAYYRFGSSEYDVRITTINQQIDADTVSLGVGNFTVTGMVKSRSVSSSDRGARVYPNVVTNVNINHNPLTAGAVVSNFAPIFQGSPDGV